MSTIFVVVVGRETAFPGADCTKRGDITDGAENTILIVEIGNSDIHWMEPRDLEIDSLMLEMDPARASAMSISSHHSAGPAVGFADSITAYRLRSPLSLSTLRALLTIAGREKVTKASMTNWDDIGLHLSESTD